MRRTLYIGLLFLCFTSTVLAQGREIAPGENLAVPEDVVKGWMIYDGA